MRRARAALPGRCVQCSLETATRPHPTSHELATQTTHKECVKNLRGPRLHEVVSSLRRSWKMRSCQAPGLYHWKPSQGSLRGNCGMSQCRVYVWGSVKSAQDSRGFLGALGYSHGGRARLGLSSALREMGKSPTLSACPLQNLPQACVAAEYYHGEAALRRIRAGAVLQREILTRSGQCLGIFTRRPRSP